MRRMWRLIGQSCRHLTVSPVFWDGFGLCDHVSHGVDALGVFLGLSVVSLMPAPWGYG